MKTLISIKTDVDVKRGIKKIAEEIGVPLSTIINAYFKQLLRERRINFMLPLQSNKKVVTLKSIQTFKATSAEKRALQRARQNRAMGQFLTIDELKHKLGFTS